jgi:hypothetical protein
MSPALPTASKASVEYRAMSEASVSKTIDWIKPVTIMGKATLKIVL